MKKFISWLPATMAVLISITLLISSFTVKADKISFLFAGYSNHSQIKTSGYRKEFFNEEYKIQTHKTQPYNETNDLLGFQYNKTVFATFNNSQDKRGFILAYDANLFTFEREQYKLEFNVAVGLVSGYEVYNIIDNISPYILPNISSTYKINNKTSLSFINGFMPQKSGIVYTYNLKLTYSF